MTLQEAITTITTAKSGKQLFGADPDQASRLYRKLSKITHPDHNPGNSEADFIFKRLGELYADSKKPDHPIVGTKHKYISHSIIGVGDIADAHFCVGLTDPTSEYILKILRVQGSESLLKNEAAQLAKLLTKAADSSYRHYFPTLVESFPVKDKFQKHVNVFLYESGYHNLEEVHAQHPNLDGRHIAWIFKRLLTAIGFAHQHGIIHGAILPQHIRIRPGDINRKDEKIHSLVLVGWGHSVDQGDTIKTISNKYRTWYPPEVLAKQAATPETDIYLAAKSMIYLAGAGIPVLMDKFLKSMIIGAPKMRPGDAWDLLDEFSELLKKLYGPPKFHHLAMT